MEEKKSWKDNPWVRGIATFLAVSIVLGIVGQGIYLKIQNDRREKELAEYQRIQQEKEAYDRSFALAGQAAQEGDYPEAIGHIEECIQMAEPDSPNETELRLTLASLQMLSGSSEQALSELIALEKENPESQEILLLKAQAELDTLDYEGAREDLEKYLTLNPEDGDVTQSLALLYEEMQDYGKAAETYRAFQTLQPDDRSGNLNAARCLILSGDYPQAEKILETMISEDSQAADQGLIHFLMGMSQMQQGNLEQAISRYGKAMELGYDQPLCLSQLAACQFVLGDFEGVLATGEQYAQLPEAPAPDAAFSQQMGIAAFTLNQQETAVDYLTKAIEADAAYPGSYFYRGLCLLAQEKWEQAAEDFSASIEADYLTTNCYYNRGLCYAELADYGKAIADMEKTAQDVQNEELRTSAEEFLPILRQEMQRSQGEAA